MPKHPEVPRIDQFPVRNPNRKVWPSSAPFRVFRWSNCGEWLPCSDLFVKPSRRECNYQNQIQIANNARHPGLGKSSKTNRKKEEGKDAVVLQGVSLILYCKKYLQMGYATICIHLLRLKTVACHEILYVWNDCPLFSWNLPNNSMIWVSTMALLYIPSLCKS